MISVIKYNFASEASSVKPEYVSPFETKKNTQSYYTTHRALPLGYGQILIGLGASIPSFGVDR